MYELSVIGDTEARTDHIGAQLAGLFKVEFTPLRAMQTAVPGGHTLIDIDLDKDQQLLPVKEWLRGKPADAKVIFVTDKTSRLQEARAYALGATGIVHRPFDAKTLLAKLLDEVRSLDDLETHEPAIEAPSVAAATDGLKSLFASVCSGAPIDHAVLHAASDAVVGEIEAQGATGWIETVRMHHSRTYQHCLLVTGVAVAFGQHIGVSRKDRQRLSVAGMLHDIGKARIPLAILEKPGRLDEHELVVMRKHPEYGLEALGTSGALPPEMLDIVVHHHELLDGSGYPHGISGSEIADLVRLVTISDIFGALIERRSYKPPMSSDAAYQILLDMGPKLDKDLVRAFKFAARIGQPQAA